MAQQQPEIYLKCTYITRFVSLFFFLQKSNVGGGFETMKQMGIKLYDLS